MPDAGRLVRDDNFGREADAFYEALLRAHSGLSDAESAALDARLILILANQIGDVAVLGAALEAARASLGRDGEVVSPTA